MKTLGLLFSLTLLAVGLWLLVSFSFPFLSFNWVDLLIYVVIALIVYGTVRAVGGALDKKFNSSVREFREFLDGKKKDLFDDKGLLRTFGLLLITLLPFLLYLLAFALYSAITFALYGFLLISMLPRVPLAVLIGLAIVAFGTGIAILIGLYYLFFPPRRKTPGIELKKRAGWVRAVDDYGRPIEQQGKLWGLTREVANEIQARPIDEIIITPGPGIGVYLDANLFSTILGGGRRVLQFGLPSLHGLTVHEFKAILAHEYGHFSNRDTQWSSFTYAMGASLISTLRSVPGPAQSGEQRGGIVGWIMSLNPAYWMLLIFINLYFTITNGFSRVREVMADIMAMNLYGGEAFGNALLTVALNDLIFTEVVQDKYVPQFLQTGKTISNFSAIMEFVHKQLDQSDIEKLQSRILSQRESHSIYDSHPALEVRMDYAKRFASREEKDKRPVSVLFDDWDDINEKAAELYYWRLLTYIRALGEAARGGSEEQKNDSAGANGR